MQSEAQGLEVEKEGRTLENNGRRQEWDGSPMMGPWMTSWSAHGKVCPSQLTDGANLHHTAATSTLVQSKASQAPWCTLQGGALPPLVHWCRAWWVRWMRTIWGCGGRCPHHSVHFHTQRITTCGKKCELKLNHREFSPWTIWGSC